MSKKETKKTVERVITRRKPIVPTRDIKEKAPADGTVDAIEVKEKNLVVQVDPKDTPKNAKKKDSKPKPEEPKVELLNEEASVDTDELSNADNKITVNNAPEIETPATRSAWLLALKRRKNVALKEKLKIQKEKEKIEVELTKLDKKLEISKMKQKEVALTVKRDVAKFKAQASVDRIADRELVKEKRSNISKKKQNLVVLKKDMEKQLSLQLSENVIKGKDILKSIQLTKAKIKEEKRNAANAIKLKKAEEKENAKKLRMELKMEQAQLKEELNKERLEQKRDIVTKKLELSIEMDEHKKEIQTRLMYQREQKRHEIAKAKRETSSLLKEKARLKAEASRARIKSRLELKELQLEADKEIEEQKEIIDNIKMETDVEVNKILEQGKLIERFIEDDGSTNMNDAQILDGPIEVAEEYYEDNEYDENFGEERNDKVIDAATGMERDATTREINLGKTKDDVVTFVRTWKNFDKKGTKLLRIVDDAPTSKEMSKLMRSAYFKVAIENYQSLTDNNQLVSFKDIIANAYILAEERIDDEVVETVYSTIVKAILIKLRVKIGNYYIVPTKVEGRKTYIVLQNMSHGEQVFDLAPLMSEEVTEGIAQIIDYKLRQGSAVQILDGLAIENYDGDLQVAINANVLRIG